jgi:hypothetical protein
MRTEYLSNAILHFYLYNLEQYIFLFLISIAL